GKTFRDDFYPEYKANRIDAPKPFHFSNIDAYLRKHYPVIDCRGIEADDAISIRAWGGWESDDDPYSNPSNVVCSADKDLNQIPGWHYSFTSGELYYVTLEEAERWLWSQVITGDSVDNIPGIKGLGKKKAEQLLGDSSDPYTMYTNILNKEIKNRWGEFVITPEHIYRTGKLVYILRYPDDSWENYCAENKIDIPS
ncbi:MAG: hypothetical protein GF393_12865, partial [Armatimonadia bacterium]|nr:hypothetical protein [Armatimonadia bacterium]